MDDKAKPTSRESFNRWVGLFFYALGVVLIGTIAVGIYAEGLGDLGSIGLFVCLAAICLAIGYTTSSVVHRAAQEGGEMQFLSYASIGKPLASGRHHVLGS